MRHNANLHKKGRTSTKNKRIRILFKGIVQGVGFRPFLYRSAQKYSLVGFVKNSSQGVILEVEGEDINGFIDYILKHPPPLSYIENYQIQELPIQVSEKFEILSSEREEQGDLLVSPDIAICENCRKELFYSRDRRYFYPFINCTDCGPRLTIIKGLPYDRPATTMKSFRMCKKCQSEYTDPADRRYHAQPISCFDCGPVLSFYPESKDITTDPLESAVEKLRDGFIVAVKGLGGYHLACKASSDSSVNRLREFKKRKRKPFALMGTVDMIKKHCKVSDKELFILSSPSAPILLLRVRENSGLSEYIAPGQNTLGFMLPYTPLHLLLLEKVGEPLVMTSANHSEEPIIFQDDLDLLKELSDSILTHNRKIHMLADDSVARIFDNQIYMVRRSRGYVPLPIDLPFPVAKKILAIGPMLKTTFTIIYKNRAIISQYIGNTDSPVSISAERFLIQQYQKLFSFVPAVVVMDKHPHYPNRILAQDYPKCEIVEIQHHRAHVASLMAEKGNTEPVIGISMDGTGYGDDGKIWGGEFFVGDYKKLERFGHLKYIFLPSGDFSIKEPWRFALSLLYALKGESAGVKAFASKFGSQGIDMLEIVKKNIAGVLTSSCGRLFDAAASLLDLGHINSYDGDLPSLLQAEAERGSKPGGWYPYTIKKEKEWELNFLPAFNEMLKDNRQIREKAFIFHRTLAKGFAEMAIKAREKYNINQVGLTGGVFQNILLLELTIDLLKHNGFEVLIHTEIPSNDNGISLGQAFLIAGKHKKED